LTKYKPYKFFIQSIHEAWRCMETLRERIGEYKQTVLKDWIEAARQEIEREAEKK